MTAPWCVNPPSRTWTIPSGERCGAGCHAGTPSNRRDGATAETAPSGRPGRRARRTVGIDVARPCVVGANGCRPSPSSATCRAKAARARTLLPCTRMGRPGASRGVVNAGPKAAGAMGSPPPRVGHVRGGDKPCAMARRSISRTASRSRPGAVTTGSISTGFMPPVIANDPDKASPPVNRLERQAGKLARAVRRGGGAGDTASLPDRPRRSRFRQRLMPGVRPSKQQSFRGPTQLGGYQ
jgi:hypothetical protein